MWHLGVSGSASTQVFCLLETHGLQAEENLSVCRGCSTQVFNLLETHGFEEENICVFEAALAPKFWNHVINNQWSEKYIKAKRSKYIKNLVFFFYNQHQNEKKESQTKTITET